MVINIDIVLLVVMCEWCGDVDSFDVENLWIGDYIDRKC